MNKILFKIFVAASKEMFREISKYFGKNTLEEVTRRDTFFETVLCIRQFRPYANLYNVKY